MLVSTILYYALFTTTWAFQVFLSPNVRIYHWCGLHKLPSFKRGFDLVIITMFNVLVFLVCFKCYALYLPYFPEYYTRFFAPKIGLRSSLRLILGVRTFR